MDDSSPREHREALGRRLRQLREQALGRQIKGLSLAAALGCTRHAIWEWEAGVHTPRPKTLEKMARFFAQNDGNREQVLRDELLALRTKAVEEVHGESAGLPPSRKGRRNSSRQTPRLSNLDPALVRACGNLFGLDYGTAGEEVAARLGHRPAGGDAFSPQRNLATTREVLVRYYDDSLSSGRLAPYAIEVNGIRHQLAVATKRTWTGVTVPLAPIGETVPTEVCDLGGSPARLGAIGEFQPRALDFLCDIEKKGLEINDAPIFRLLRMGLRQGRLQAAFGVDSFLRYRFTIGLLAEELVDALALACPDEVVAQRERWLPLRGRFLPDGGALARPSSRVCSGGVLTCTAIARGHGRGDFLVLVQRRSPRVSDAPGLLSVIPKAFHQPIGFPHDAMLAREVGVSSTLYRELFEEVLGGREVEVAGTQLEPEWYVRASKPLRWLRSRPESYRAWCVGLGFNLLSGNYEVGTMLVIHDPRFWDAFESQLRPNWEADRLLSVTTRRAVGNEELEAAALLDGPQALERWTSEGLFVLVEGLARLKAMYPDRTSLPKLKLGRLAPREEALV